MPIIPEFRRIAVTVCKRGSIENERLLRDEAYFSHQEHPVLGRFPGVTPKPRMLMLLFRISV